jgi:hypothetical protein
MSRSLRIVEADSLRPSGGHRPNETRMLLIVLRLLPLRRIRVRYQFDTRILRSIHMLQINRVRLYLIDVAISLNWLMVALLGRLLIHRCIRLTMRLADPRAVVVIPIC